MTSWNGCMHRCEKIPEQERDPKAMKTKEKEGKYMGKHMVNPKAIDPGKFDGTAPVGQETSR